MAEELTQDGLRKEIKEAFGGALRAVSEDQPFDLIAIPQVIRGLDEEEGGVWLALYPSATKEFRLFVTDVDDQGDEWLVTTPEQRWSFRPVPETVDRERFIKDMREAGVG